MYQNSQTTKDEVLKSYISQIFNLYDPQGTGFLTVNNITNFFNDLFKSVGVALTLSPQQSHEAIKAVYPGYTTRVTKDQLFVVFKVMLGLQAPPPVPPPISNAQYGYAPSMMGGGYMNPQGYYPPNMQQNYMEQFNQAQNYMMMQNMMRQGQMPSGNQTNRYGQQPNNPSNGSR